MKKGFILKVEDNDGKVKVSLEVVSYNPVKIVSILEIEKARLLKEIIEEHEKEKK